MATFESSFNISGTFGSRNSAADFGGVILDIIPHSALPVAVSPTIVQDLVESHTLSYHFQQHFF